MEWNNGIVFHDRADAGRRLAVRLAVHADTNTIVLGLPRGGIVVAYEVASTLAAHLDAFIVRKIGAPDREELGVGAVAPGGVRVLDGFAIRFLGITDEQLDRSTAAAVAEMERRLSLYRGDRPLPDLRGKTVILVDDGLATGVTARAAVRAIRLQRPGSLILAVPVCAADTAANLHYEVDEFICLSSPVDFRAVGLWYEHFEQVTDAQVIDLLERAREASGTGV